MDFEQRKDLCEKSGSLPARKTPECPGSKAGKIRLNEKAENRSAVSFVAFGGKRISALKPY